MKKILVLLLSLFLCKEGFAQKGQQAFGLIAGSEITDLNYYRFGEWKPTISYSGGVYYDLNISRRFGFNVSPVQRISTQELQFWWCIDCNDRENRYYFHSFEIPINVTLNLDSKESAKWKTYFSIGYTYSYLFLVRDKETGETVALDNRNLWLDRNGHYLNVGLEVRHNFGENYTLSINPVSRIDVNFEFGEPSIGLNFRIGRIL